MLVHPARPFSRLGAGHGLPRLVEEVHDGSGEFRRPLGAAFFRYEPWEALRGTLVLQGLQVAPGAATVCGRWRHGVTVACDAPAPRILPLARVIRIKKGRGLAQGVLHLLRRRVQGAGSRPFFPFGPPRGARLLQGSCPQEEAR